jgi:DeoR/GlpR family transcriptional regulator of sugar metabolism
VNTLMQVAPLNLIHYVVSDDGLPETAIRALQEHGIKVITPSSRTIAE